MAAALVGDHRRLDVDRRAFVRRTRRNDAASRRPIRLSARGVFTAVGFPIRLDAVHGDPDRNDRRGRCSFCAIPRNPLAGHFRKQLPDSSAPYFHQLRGFTFHRAIAGDPRDPAVELDQLARPALRQARSEFFHGREDRIARGAGRAWSFLWLESRGGRRQLRRSMDAAWIHSFGSGADAGDDVRIIGGPVRRANRIAVFGRRLE